jgi:hypothetical protein
MIEGDLNNGSKTDFGSQQNRFWKLKNSFLQNGKALAYKRNFNRKGFGTDPNSANYASLAVLPRTHSPCEYACIGKSEEHSPAAGRPALHTKQLSPRR